MYLRMTQQIYIDDLIDDFFTEEEIFLLDPEKKANKVQFFEIVNWIVQKWIFASMILKCET